MILRMVALGAALLLGACNAQPETASAPQQSARTSPQGLPLIPLEIRSAGRTRLFTVEVASTPEQQAQGLMGREVLASNAGMLFPFSPPRPASFWMKNTLIPLDMIFIRPDGRIGRIAAKTVPHSLEPVAFDEPAAAVLEIRGGRAAELGIRVGDRVSWAGGPAPRP